MAGQLTLKIDDFTGSGEWEIKPPDDTSEWEFVTADVKVNAPTVRFELWSTHVAVLWRLKRD